MLYRALRFTAGVALRWYYGEITLVGGERIPRDTPLLLVVNHPNALVDALVVGWLVPRPVRITAKAVLFDQPLLGAFLRTLGVVPLRRASDERARRRGTPDAAAPKQEDALDAPGRAAPDPSRNAASFDAILDSLDRGSAVLIFPEGKSHDAPHLEPLKTGPARIALAARDAGRAAGLRIVPIALVFESKDALRSRVLAVVGDGIDVHAWTAGLPGQARIEALTADIEARLRAVMLTAPSADHLAELQVLATHVAEVLAPESPPVGAGRSLREEYVVATRLAGALDALEQLPPPLRHEAEAARSRMAAFMVALRAAGIAPADMGISLRKRHGARFALREAALLAVAGPVAAWGRVNHWIPFRLARRLALRNVTARDQPAMRTIVAGLGTVLAAYVVQAALAWWLVGGWVALAYLVTLPVAADVDLRYSGRARTALRRMRAYLRLRRDPRLASALAGEREALASAIRSLDGRLAAASPRAAEG